jgi:hypothetical protein
MNEVAFSRRGWELLDEPQLSQPEKKSFYDGTTLS